MALSKKEILKASREREKQKKDREHLFGLILILLIVVIFLITMNLSFLRVNDINVVGQTSADPSAIEKFVNDRLSGYYIGVVPKDNIFFVYKNNLAEYVKGQFPGLAEVLADWPDLNTLSFRVADRESKILWCNSGVASSTKQCYYLSPEGEAYQKAPSFSDSLFIELHGSQALKKMGSRVIDPKSLTRAKIFLNFFKSSMSLWPENGLKLRYAEIYAQNDFRIVMNKAGDPSWQGRVLFNTENTMDNTITNLNSVLKNDGFRNDWQSAEGKLDYLDLRFPTKVFYRFK